MSAGAFTILAAVYGVYFLALLAVRARRWSGPIAAILRERRALSALRLQERRIGHYLAAVDRQFLARHYRRGDSCPVLRMHFVNARAAWRATHRKGGAK